jgi:tetratricopeptide (TPR) repeat protein
MTMRKDMHRKGLNLLLGGALLGLAGQAVAHSRGGDWRKEAMSDSLSYHGYKELEADKAKAGLKFFEKATKVDSENASAFEGLGDTWAALGKDDKAQDAWSKADNLDGGKTTRTQSVRVGSDGSLTDQSIQNSEAASDYSAHAYTAASRGDYRYAVELFKKALGVDKYYWHARKGLDVIVSGGMDKDQTLPTRAGSGRDDDGDDN